MTGGQAPPGRQMPVSTGTFEHYTSTRHSHPSTPCFGEFTILPRGSIYSWCPESSIHLSSWVTQPPELGGKLLEDRA